MAAAAAEELRRTAGVRPCRAFWAACRDAAGAAAVDADAALRQVLAQDLRDVVRQADGAADEPHDIDVDDDDDEEEDAPVALRRAVAASLASPFQAALPAAFRLLVQVEEAVDMARGTEARCGGVGGGGGATPEGALPSTGNGHPSAGPPAPAGRCLKLLLSDGYHPDGRASSAGEENRDPASSHGPLLVGMEVSPVPRLTTDTPAGAKLLLRGPLAVRHGLLQLTAASAVLLGGAVPPLEDLRRAARRRARHRAGVDATVRALIGPEGLMGDSGEAPEEEDDVGEGESRDVPAHGSNVTIQPQVHAAAAPSGRTLPSTSQRSPLSQPRHLPPPRPATSDGPRPATPNSVTPLTALHLRLPDDGTANRPAALDGGGRHPSEPVPRSVVANPYAGPSGTTAPVPRNDDMDATSAARHGPSPYATEPRPTVPSATPASLSPVAPSTQSSSRPGPAATVSEADPPPPLPMALDELRHLLGRCRGDEALYAEHYGGVYRTRLRQEGVKLYFNIDKRRKQAATAAARRDERGDDKYEYAMIARFKSPDSDGLITCKIASSIIEPFFGVKPGDMRKMNREDKQKANEIVREGGRKVQELLNAQHCYKWTLEQPPQEFHSKQPESDGDVPVVLLLGLLP